MMIRIFLIGYMGAGKTTLGKAFAKKYNLSFVDLDWYIEERFHKTVQELFAERGEDGFRELERNMLHEVADFENVIISTGGGAPCFFYFFDFVGLKFFNLKALVTTVIELRLMAAAANIGLSFHPNDK